MGFSYPSLASGQNDQRERYWWPGTSHSTGFSLAPAESGVWVERGTGDAMTMLVSEHAEIWFWLMYD